MIFAPGTRLGPYEIVAFLGAGGMGKVYRARDTQLKREVALKVLPPEVAADADRFARFQREAELLAALNHPNIAQIHGLVEAGPASASARLGSRALVMELIEGETLAERIGRGPVPVEESLPLAGQLAEALEYAHERGIIHRDLKPANIKLTPDGRLKVLDFGLAKALDVRAAVGDPAAGPTLTSPAMTQAGIILGTAAYMSPEQARGAAVDKRTDIWAFGVVLFEMLTGRPCFPGDSVTDVLAAVVKSEPDWAALPADTPPRMRDMLRRCLAKDRKQRLRDIGDARLEIEAASASPAGPEADPSLPLTAAAAAASGFWPRRRAMIFAATALLVGAAATAVLIWQLRSRTTKTGPGIVRLDMPVVGAEELNAGGRPAVGVSAVTPGGSRTALVWTPDGRSLVFVGRRAGVQQLYIRALDEPEARPLAGTEGAQLPVVSLDGQDVAFWADGAIRKTPLTKGPVENIFERVPDPPFGLAWGEAGLLVGSWDAYMFGTGAASILLVTPGSPPKPVTLLKQGEMAHILPQWLPGGSVFLYTAKKRFWTWSGDEVFAQNLAGGAPKKILDDAVDARYVPGHLVFLRLGQLRAVRFDPARLEVHGESVGLLDNVAQALANVNAVDDTGAGQFGVAPTGGLAYLENTQVPWPDDARIVTVDRRGVVTPLPTPPKSFAMNVRIDPDGRRIAAVVQELRERSVWVFDLLDRGKFITKLGTGGEVGSNRVWTPDGKHLAFSWIGPDGVRALVWQAADGSAPPEKLADEGDPGDWTPKSRELLGVKNKDIWMLASRGGVGGPRPIVQSPWSIEEAPTLSPCGRWLAYASDLKKTGHFDVFLQPFPGSGSALRQTVSVDGGVCPAWNPRGRELFYVSLPDAAGMRRLMSVAVQLDAVPPGLGSAKELFRFHGKVLRFYATPYRPYDVAPDGQSFFVTEAIAAPPPPPVTHIRLVLNWIEEVKAKLARQ